LEPGNYFVRGDLPGGWLQTGLDHGHGHDDEVVTAADAGPPAAEPNDTLATAVPTGLVAGAPGTFKATGGIGDRADLYVPLDVDLYRFQAQAGDRVRVDVDAEAFHSAMDGVLRVFDANGLQLASNADRAAEAKDPVVEFIAPATGTYYAGVSGFANAQYDPAVDGSGVAGLAFNYGAYTVQIDVGPRPGAEPVAVALAADEARAGVDLGFARPGTVRGQMYADVNGNGAHDPGEPGLDGWLVVLEHDGAHAAFETTRSIDVNRDGRIDAATEAGWYEFDDLRPGTYFTRGLITFGVGAPGWVQTSPAFDPSAHEGIGVVPTGPGSDAGPGLVPDLTVDLKGGLFDWFETAGVLHFGQSTPNIGAGPMELRAGAVQPDGTRAVVQRIYQDAGLTTYTDREAGTFSYHPEHNHIHFDDFTTYTLRKALPDADGDGQPDVGAAVAGGEKTSFCLTDIAPYDLNLAGAPTAPSGYGCGEIQRISVGWTDIYGPLTPGQQIDVSHLPPGQY
ncbi:MAG TPA: pre-peptidase C-terminal domain-containing protein, partial [Gemmataceae bacterium]|nr:pre-peptidase C-terminal domain-containing protein [Gemmataceae bacterium]